MSDATMLVFLSIVMLIGSYMAGSVPLIMTLSEERLHLASILGAGLLVGAALTVIIPEGINMLYSQVIQEIERAHEKTTSATAGALNREVHSHGTEGLHSVIGLALVLGFIFMLLVDQIGSSRSRDPESGSARSSKSFTATLGLVVHAAVDGIALGAAATTSHAAVEMIVFLAIMLHKVMKLN